MFVCFVWLGIALTIIAVIILLIFLFLRKRINLAVEVIKEASKSVCNMYHPLLCFCLQKEDGLFEIHVVLTCSLAAMFVTQENNSALGDFWSPDWIASSVLMREKAGPCTKKDWKFSISCLAVYEKLNRSLTTFEYLHCRTLRLYCRMAWPRYKKIFLFLFSRLFFALISGV